MFIRALHALGEPFTQTVALAAGSMAHEPFTKWLKEYLKNGSA